VVALAPVVAAAAVPVPVELGVAAVVVAAAEELDPSATPVGPAAEALTPLHSPLRMVEISAAC